MTLPGFSVGNIANIIPNKEKHKEAKANPKAKIRGLATTTPKNAQAANKVTKLMNMLNKTPPNALPKIMAYKEIGAETSRSKVLTRLSVGIATGPIEEAENKTVNESSPGIKMAGAMFLPTAKAKNINSGNIIPNINVEGLR